MMTSQSRRKVLIVTGSMITAQDKSLRHVVKKQVDSFRASSGAWLDIRTKIMIAEEVLAFRRYRRSRGYRRSAERSVVDEYFANSQTNHSPELTEVVLATALEAAGIDFEVSTYSELYADRRLRRRLLDECGCVFASTTLLRDYSEFTPLIEMLKTSGNRVVVGGALTTMLPDDHSNRFENVDVVAVGYGETLVPAIASWISTDYKELQPPDGGRLEWRGKLAVLHSDLPKSKGLDFLPRPDWSLAERYHGRQFSMVYYESVRGCPYRCAFCNYPFLFSDNKFRYKSAGKIADDWQHYAASGAKYITCLDSLFTMPKRRLLELCDLLVKRNVDVKWICYARADDLCDLDVCEALKAAGCHQVQIGVESGSQVVLANMAKQCTVENNAQAIINCRKVGISTAATAIIGFPGETKQTVQQTIDLFRAAPPDFYYAACFNTRFELMPILNPKRAQSFGLVTQRGGNSSIPYWRHDTMCSVNVCDYLEEFNRVMKTERISLDGAIFYDGFLDYDLGQREALLEYQKSAYLSRGRFYRGAFRVLSKWAQHYLEDDVERVFSAGKPMALEPALLVKA